MLEASKAKAKLYGLVVDKAELTNKDNKDTPKDSNNIAIALLADVGIVSSDDATKEKPLEAYDVMIATLEAIAAAVLGKAKVLALAPCTPSGPASSRSPTGVFRASL